MDNKVDISNDWKFRSDLRRIVDQNCKEIPWEGTEVDKDAIVEGFLDYLIRNNYSIIKNDK